MEKKFRYFLASVSSCFSPNTLFCVLLASFLSVSCVKKEENYAPKPRGYFRLDLPKHEYQLFDTTGYPYSFNYSKHAHWIPNKKEKKEEQYWMDIEYPGLNATLYLTYFQLKDQAELRNHVISEEKMVEFHFKKADGVDYSIINDSIAKVYGRIYDIRGKGVACPLQFWLTDSTSKYLRASLYFNHTPNNDSLQPVIEYLREDVLEIINTFKWK